MRPGAHEFSQGRMNASPTVDYRSAINGARFAYGESVRGCMRPGAHEFSQGRMNASPTVNYRGAINGARFARD